MNQKLKLVLELVKNNPDMDIDALLEIADLGNHTKENEEVKPVTKSNQSAEPTNETRVSGRRHKYTKEEDEFLFDTLREAGYETRYVPKEIINEIADMCGVSYQAIYSRLSTFERHGIRRK